MDGNYLCKTDRLLRLYREGVYTMRELFPLLVYRTPEGMEAELVKLIPMDVRGPFRNWLFDYPMEGGIKIRGTEGDLSIAVIAKLKELLGSSVAVCETAAWELEH